MNLNLFLRKVGGYVDFAIESGSTVIDVGFLDKKEVEELREVLKDAIDWLEDE